MSIARYPEVVATTTTEAPVVIEPGRTVQWPQQVVLRIDATPEGAVGWLYTFNAAGSGADRVRIYAGKRMYNPEFAINAYLDGSTVAPTPVNPTPSLRIYRTVRGLIPGRQYRLNARVAAEGGGSRVRIRMGGQASAWLNNAPWTGTTPNMAAQTVTFTATGDEEDLIVEAEDNPASNTAAGGTSLAVASITVTGLAYTQVIPPVIDDQVDLTVYDGKITADAGWAPYLQAGITVPASSVEVAAALDPDGGTRVRLTASSVRDLVTQYTPWTVTRRNLHPDPGHTGTARAIGGGILMSCYQPLTGNNTGTVDKPNRHQLYGFGSGFDAQEINVKTLPAGALFGFSVTTDPPPSSSTKARLYYMVTLNTATAGGAVPTTMVAAVRVIQGSTTLLSRTLAMPAYGTTYLTIDNELLDTPAGPGGIRIEVAVENRGTATWTTPGTTVGILARVESNRSSLVEGDVAALPVISDSVSWSPPLDQFNRYRKVSNTVVWEQCTLAPSIIETVDTRTFDLALTKKELDHDSGELRLTLASDEYLLQRFSKLIADAAPRLREHSLRSVVEYVLGQALGTVDPLAGTADANVTAQWALDNLALDPRCTTPTSVTFGGATATVAATTGISSVLGTGCTTCATATLTAAASSWFELRKTLSVRGGETYSLRVAGRFSIAGTGTAVRSSWARIFWLDKDGNPLGEVAGPAASMSDPGAGSSPWVWLTLTAVKAPPGATQARCIMRVVGPLTSGSTVEATCWQLVADRENVLYFDGYTANTATYVYTWTGDPNVSTSNREPVIEREPDSLVWSAGQTAWDFLTGLVNGQGLRLWCDEGRVWHLTDPDDYTAPGHLTVTPATTVELLDRVDGERGEYADGVVITWNWIGYGGVQRTRLESAGSPGKVVALEFDAPFPGAGTAAAHLAKLQRRGTEQPLTVAADYRATPDQPLTITSPDGTQRTGEIGAVTWNLTDGLMQIEPTNLALEP